MSLVGLKSLQLLLARWQHTRAMLPATALKRKMSHGAPALQLLNVYVPNSGASLQRLAYRTDEGGWDAQLRAAVDAAAAPT